MTIVNAMGPAMVAGGVVERVEGSAEVKVEKVVRVRLVDRVLPVLVKEEGRERGIWVGVMFAIALLYMVMVFGFWAPADGGVDQNAYLVGGRMIAEHGTTRLDLQSPFAYVGAMFIRTAGGNYYPKYPIGLPLLYAVVFWIFGAGKAVTYVFAVSPLSAVAAGVGMFYLARQVAGSFAGLMAAILLGTSQLMLMLANNPNSHASCTAFGVWGIFLLIRWWQTGSWWRGVLAGFFLGFACLIRYSEGLLILPIAVAVLHRLRWSDWRSWLRNAVPVVAWLIPVGAMAIYNKTQMGYWTGYDSTRESEFGAAFTLAKLSTTWEQMLRTMYDTGLFFTLPLGIAGLAMMFRKSWQLGLAMVLWFVPGVALYTSYYFSPDMGLAYARFFLTFLPPALVGAAVCFSDGFMGMRGHVLKSETRVKWSGVIAVGLVTMIAASVGVYRSLVGMESGRSGGEGLVAEYATRKNLSVTGEELSKNIPDGATVFTGQGGGVKSSTNYIQFMGDWRVFTTGAFNGLSRRDGGMGRMGAGGVGADGLNAVVTPRQAEETEYEQALYAKYSPSELADEEAKVINTAITTGKRVFVVATPAEVNAFTRELRDRAKYAFVTVGKWTDYEDPVEEDDAGGPFGGAGRMGGGRNGGGGGGGGGRNGGGRGQNFGGPGGGGPPFGGPGGGGPPGMQFGGGGPGGGGGPFGGGGRRMGGVAAGSERERGADWELVEIRMRG